MWRNNTLYIVTTHSIAESLKVDKAKRVTILAAFGNEHDLQRYMCTLSGGLLTSLGFDVPVVCFYQDRSKKNTFSYVPVAEEQDPNGFMFIFRACQMLTEVLATWDTCTGVRQLIVSNLKQWHNRFGLFDALLSVLLEDCFQTGALCSFRHLVHYTDNLFNEVDIKQKPFTFRRQQSRSDEACL